MRILFLSRWFPYPPNNGSKIRIFNILRQLSVRHEVTLLTFAESTDQVDSEAVASLRQHCPEVVIFPYRSYRPSSPRALLGLLSTRPRYLVDTHSAEMSRAVGETCARKGTDLIIASELAMAPYALERPDLPAVLEEVELTGYLDAARCGDNWKKRGRATLTWLKLTAYLRNVLPRFAACTVVSQPEEATLRGAVPGYDRVSVIPNALDLDRYDGDFGSASPNCIIYCGALTYSANYDAVHYFLTDIYPLILRHRPDATFTVTGGCQGVDLRGLPRRPRVVFTGHLTDPRPELAQSSVSVVPLRSGGGTRLKILESMALGTPVVSTSKGAEGLDVTDGSNILLADSAAEFAQKVTLLLHSKEMRSRLARGGRALVAEKYNWRVVGSKLLALVDQVASAGGDQVEARRAITRKVCS